MVYSRGVVIAAARRFGECVVGVVNDLKFARSFRTLGRVDWDTIGVSLQCGAEREK